jgi:4-alpha-glucanotransferase
MGFRLGLYNDLAVACDKAGPDRWANQELFAQGLRIGSPPDDFNVNGQDWGFPALRPLHQCPDVLGYFRESLRSCARAAGVIRLDHVMRLARLYSIPDGHPASHGVYIRDHFQALLHVIAIESHRNRTLVVGEDLGTVPEYFRSALDEFGILSYRLVMFEWHGADLKPAEHYPANALCSFSTHDLATFDGYLSAADLGLRKSVGFLSDEAFGGALEERRRNLEAFRRAFGAANDVQSTDEFFAGMIGFLLRTPCRLVLIGLDELLGEKTQMNLPGTTSEHPNWRLKARIALEHFSGDATLTRRLQSWTAALSANADRPQ